MLFKILQIALSHICIAQKVYCCKANHITNHLLVTKVLINPIVRTITRRFRHAYHPTRDILVSEVGGSDRIGFFSSGYDRKHVTTGIRSGTDWIRLIRLLDL
jgi:hypothetical protein